MCELKRTKRKNGKLRLTAVDNWHNQWDAVQEHVQRRGDVSKLAIDNDGWLSARQVLLVVFVGDEVTAHVCFEVTLAKKCVVAKMVSHGVETKFRGMALETLLRDAAVRRAKELKCGRTLGFKLATAW